MTNYKKIQIFRVKTLGNNKREKINKNEFKKIIQVHSTYVIYLYIDELLPNGGGK